MRESREEPGNVAPSEVLVTGADISSKITDLLADDHVVSAKPDLPHLLVGPDILVSAIAALAVYTFVVAGLLDLRLGEVSTGLIPAVALAAGFTERLMIRAVETARQ